MVTGIEQVVRGLECAGVIFEQPGASTFQGQAGAAVGSIVDYGPVRSAWLKDTEGNCIALNEVVVS